MVKTTKKVKDFEIYKNKFMQEALLQAQKAARRDEVPIGVVIVKDNKIIARAYNKRNRVRNALFHAEMLAIQKACKKIGDWRLEECDLFVTLTPCPMCAGAIVNARVGRVFYGASNQNKELFEKILTQSDLNHNAEFFGGIMEEECSSLLKGFFLSKRN